MNAQVTDLRPPSRPCTYTQGGPPSGSFSAFQALASGSLHPNLVMIAVVVLNPKTVGSMPKVERYPLVLLLFTEYLSFHFYLPSSSKYLMKGLLQLPSVKLLSKLRIYESRKENFAAMSEKMRELHQIIESF
jgi:hypothetical protein